MRNHVFRNKNFLNHMVCDKNTKRHILKLASEAQTGLRGPYWPQRPKLASEAQTGLRSQNWPQEANIALVSEASLSSWGRSCVRDCAARVLVQFMLNCPVALWGLDGGVRGPYYLLLPTAWSTSALQCTAVALRVPESKIWNHISIQITPQNP